MGRGHHRGIALDERSEFHTFEHIAAHVDARRHLGQREAFLAQTEDSTLRDVEYVLPTPERLATRIRDLLDVVYELDDLAMLDDAQTPGPDIKLGTLGVEGPAEHDLFGVLRDVDEAARPDCDAAELRNVHISDLVDLAEAEERDI